MLSDAIIVGVPTEDAENRLAVTKLPIVLKKYTIIGNTTHKYPIACTLQITRSCMQERYS